jgi:nicotinate-nucleotide adenylyltransferase
MNSGTGGKIGILGGTFNPIHIGHLILAQSAIEGFDLSKVLFVPCFQPPHKKSTALVAAKHRLAMIEAAIEGDLRFEVSDVEIGRGGISYAIDTIRQLHQLHPDSKLHFIIGSDTLTELYLWKNIYDLLKLCRFVTFGRPGRDARSLRPEDLHLKPPWPEQLLQDCSDLRRIDVSSSDIRYRLAEGMSIRYLVPPPVEMYIAEHHLYV